MAFDKILRRPVVSSGLVMMILSGCGKEDIRVYRVPKEDQKATMQALLHEGHDHGHSAESARAQSESAPAPRVRWKLPSGWEEKPAGGMRAGSFAIAKGDKQADVSIVPLGGVAGGELSNVNRWREQLGLPAVDAGELDKQAQEVEVGASKGRFFELSGTVSQDGQKHPARILAAILPAADATWFFKMLGDDALVRDQKPVFVEFLKSISFADPSETIADDGPKRPTPAAPPKSVTTATSGKPAWDAPANWKEQTPSQMILASYQVGESDGAKAVITISSFPGDVGGALANVNRWRGQLSLAPIAASELSSTTTSLDVLGGKAMLVDMNGTEKSSGRKARLIAASVPRAGSTWFYKLMGDEAVVAREQGAFLKFVQTVRYAND